MIDKLMNDKWMNDKPSRVYAKISLTAVKRNFEVMRSKMNPATKMCAVVKTDAYGHGAVQISRFLEAEAYIWGFAVATAAEAIQLRMAGITKPILVLGYVFPEDYPDLVKYEIRPAMFDEESAEKLSGIACAMGKTAPVHIAVDTGMTRIGVRDNEEAVQEVLRISRLPGISIEGMFTHFARADEADKSTALLSMNRFRNFCDLCEKAGVRIPIRHCSNSAAILELPQAHMDMVRAGITVYGIYPSDEMDRENARMYPVMEIRSHLTMIKEVPAGTPVSYGGTYIADKKILIGTVPMGYGDGYPRSLSNKGYVLIHGRKAPILGRVCMDQFMVDVTDIPVTGHDEVTIMGRDGDEYLSVDELGRLSGRFPYEFVCDISRRVPRIYEQSEQEVQV